MEMPEVDRCFGIFPPRYASFLIAVLGLGIGGVGLAGIILFGLVEDSIVAHFIKNQKTDPGVKKAVLVTIGLSSLMLVIASCLLILGVITSSGGSVVAAKWIIFILCFLLLLAVMGAPVSCFFLPTTCFVKKISVPLLLLAYTAVMIFIQLWLYFMVVVHNFQLEVE